MDLEISIEANWPDATDWEKLAERAVAALAQVAPELGNQRLSASILFAGDAEVHALNREWRGKDKPTNVLSFPTTAPAGVKPQPLGDIVICPAVLKREAREQGKPERAHWAHLVVHGTLHLVGYDHEDDADARRMERREVAVLRRLGFPDPYRSL